MIFVPLRSSLCTCLDISEVINDTLCASASCDMFHHLHHFHHILSDAFRLWGSMLSFSVVSVKLSFSCSCCYLSSSECRPSSSEYPSSSSEYRPFSSEYRPSSSSENRPSSSECCPSSSECYPSFSEI